VGRVKGATKLGAKSNRSLALESRVPNGESGRDIESRRHCLTVIGLDIDPEVTAEVSVRSRLEDHRSTAPPRPNYESVLALSSSMSPANGSDAPPENANELPGGNLNTAGGKVRDASIADALKAVKVDDFKEIHKKPCVRDAFLPGIGASFAVGGIRAIMGGASGATLVLTRSNGHSPGVRSMYLGGRYLLPRLSRDVRVLPKKEAARKGRDAKGCRGHRSQKVGETAAS